MNSSHNTTQFINKDAFAKSIGIKLLEVSKGYARAELTINPTHLNGLQTVHGGVIFTLADLAFAAAANSHDCPAMAININISYMKAVSEGTLIAEAIELSKSNKLATYNVIVTSDAGDHIAHFHGMAYRKKTVEK